MYEFEINNKATSEYSIIFGYNFADACRRAKINPKDWECLSAIYVD